MVQIVLREGWWNCMAKSTTKKHKTAGNEIQTIDENLHKKPNKVFLK